MTPEQICKNLRDMWPSFGKGYYAWLDTFTQLFKGVPADELQRAYDATMREWDGLSYPKPADFEKHISLGHKMSHVTNHRRMFEEVDALAGDLVAIEERRLSQTYDDWSDIKEAALYRVRRRANLEAQARVLPRYGLEVRYWKEARLTDEDIAVIRQAIASQQRLSDVRLASA